MQDEQEEVKQNALDQPSQPCSMVSINVLRFSVLFSLDRYKSWPVPPVSEDTEFDECACLLRYSTHFSGDNETIL